MGNAKYLIKFGAMLALISFFVNAFAAEGVIEINQAKINAAGGGTYTINQPGSYRLTSNLTQPNITTNVITISADNVSIDLNGFSIIGANSCSASGVCTGNGSGAGIYSADRRNVSISNGNITRIAGSCVHSLFSGGNLAVDRVRISDCGIHGITGLLAFVSNSSVATCNGDGVNLFLGIVSNSVAENNVGRGFIVTQGRVVSSVSQWNGSEGIHASQVQDSFATNNQSSGIYVTGLASGNHTYLNVGVGIAGPVTGTITQNTLQCNLSSDCLGTTSQKSGVVSIPAGSNSCNGNAC